MTKMMTKLKKLDQNRNQINIYAIY